MGVELKPRKLPVGQRTAEFLPATWNPEKRTIDVVWTTGAKGKRGGFFVEPYFEELEVSDKAVRLERLNAGAAVLDTHGQYRLQDQFGVVERAWLADGRGVATLRLSKRTDVDAIVQDIADGIIRNISVGYIVHRYKDVSGPDDRMKTYRAVDWEPCEISFVPVPFDAGAQVRSGEGEGKSWHQPPLFEVEVIEAARDAAGSTQENEDMSKKTDEGGTAVDTKEIEKRAMEAERTRAAGIREVTRKLGLDAKLADDHVAKGTDLEAFRSLAIDAKATAEEKTETRTHHVEVTSDEHETRARGMETALLHARNPKVHALDDNGRRFMGRSLLEMGRLHLEGYGVRTAGMPRHSLAQRILTFRSGMLSTSDFPFITANVANKELAASYDALAARATWTPLAKRKTVPDFKTVSRTRRGEAPDLVLNVEGAEVTYGALSEEREQYAIARYARRLALTEETIINDDMGAFLDLASDMGLAAARLESDLVWQQFTSNPDMGDSVAVFHSSHANVGTSGVISVTTIGEGFELMALQTGVDTTKPLNIEPAYLIVPKNIEVTALQFVSEKMLAAQASNINPFAGRLKVISDGRLDAADTTDWYLAADPSSGIDVLQVATLEGTSGPIVEMQDGWAINGVELKVKHYFAAKFLDWRGVFMNEGGS